MLSVPSASEADHDASAEQDLGGGAIDRALRLGSAAIGTALIFTQTGSHADAAGGRSPLLPPRSFEENTPVVSGDERLGTLRAIDLAGRAPLDRAQRMAIADVAALIASDLVTHRRLDHADPVTGLPNRRDFELGFAAAVEAAGPSPTLAVVTLAEAGRYAEIVRTLGLANAESFVRGGAAALFAVVGRSGPIWHVGPLNLAFLVTADRAEPVAAEIVHAFAGSIMCGSLPILTEAGVGLAPVIAGRSRPAEILRAAVAAAQDSFEADRGYAFYDLASDEAHKRSFRLLTDLDEALRDYGQLSLVYQPRIELSTGRLVGAEALLRWSHPTLGSVAPSEFIALAETTALIGPLTDFVLTRASRQAAAWRRAGLQFRTSVNISPKSLREAGFLARVDQILAAASIPAEAMEFEFTEGVLTKTDATVRAQIDGIRERGIAIAIDDFGMGYSNIEALTRLPADVLKIDKSLVQRIDVDKRRRRLCHAMIELARDFGFRVVAEGVETEAVRDILRAWRCEDAQGFLMSRPLSAADLTAFAKAASEPAVKV